MFSNDQNIETIGQLIETLKHYIKVQGEYVKLSAVEKTVRILTAIAITAIISVLLIFILIFLSFAAVFALEPLVVLAGAFCIIAGIYVAILLMVIAFRRQWFERPLVRFLADILLS